MEFTLENNYQPAGMITFFPQIPLINAENNLKAPICPMVFIKKNE
jgi:hypothetical protein